MLTQPISASLASPKVGSACHSVPDQFRAITGHAGLVASEFSYKKDEEIYGEDEPAEYVYQVICGSVRSYKLLSDGRRQIGAFYLPGDVFGAGATFAAAVSDALAKIGPDGFPFDDPEDEDWPDVGREVRRYLRLPADRR